jgi:hypothetical protein
MLTVEQRHALIVCFEEARRTVRAFQHLHTASAQHLPGEGRIDSLLSGHIADALAQREFYELLNSLTDWGMHPAAYEPALERRQ